MQQKSGDHWCCFGFFSKKLNSTESHYSTFDQELLAAYLSIHHFCHFCEGYQFQLWTGHKPLLTSMSRVTPPRSPCQQHQLAFISEFNVQMLYLPGLQNVLANFLSRPTSVPGNVAAVTAIVPANVEEMAVEQNRYSEMQRLLGGTSLAIAFLKVGNQHLVSNVSTGVFHPVVPTKYQKYIFSHLYNMSHPGRLTSRHLFSSRFVWFGLARDMTAWAKTCLRCQQSKTHFHNTTRLLHIPVPCPPASFLPPPHRLGEPVTIQ